jgi:hypothetical protein
MNTNCYIFTTENLRNKYFHYKLQDYLSLPSIKDSEDTGKAYKHEKKIYITSAMIIISAFLFYVSFLHFWIRMHFECESGYKPKDSK